MPVAVVVDESADGSTYPTASLASIDRAAALCACASAPSCAIGLVDDFTAGTTPANMSLTSSPACLRSTARPPGCEKEEKSHTIESMTSRSAPFAARRDTSSRVYARRPTRADPSRPIARF